MTQNEKEKGCSTPIEYVDSSVVDYDSLDADTKRLHELGYKQEFKREISLFVQAGFAFSIMAVLPNWLVGLSAAINAGGPSSLFWCLIVVFPFTLCIALAMAEIFSAYPVNGGVYSWCYLLSNKEWGPLMAWICGYACVVGLMTGGMTVSYTMGDYILSIIRVFHPDSTINGRGLQIGLYIVFLTLASLCSSLGIRFSSCLNKFMVGWVFVGTMVIVITLPVMAPTHPPAYWVFTEFSNNTGYSNMGLVFLLGLLQSGWSLLGYECGAQLAEGTKNAEINGPRGIIIAVLCAGFQCALLCLSTLFSIQDIYELQMSASPVITLFLRATNKPVSVFFVLILFVTQFGAMCNCILACAQMLWSMARDGCVPYSAFLYKLSGTQKTPVRILCVMLVIEIVVILPAFASEVYWSAIMSTAVICLNVSYGLPYVCRLIWSRNSMHKGPFNLGKLSIPINVISVSWIAFFCVVLCIPTVHPVSPVTMNWTSLMIGACIIFVLGFWFASGRKTYKGPMQTADMH